MEIYLYPCVVCPKSTKKNHLSTRGKLILQITGKMLNISTYIENGEKVRKHAKIIVHQQNKADLFIVFAALTYFPKLFQSTKILK